MDLANAEAAERESISWFAYVRWEDVHAREAEGWTFAAGMGPHHSLYSVLMESPAGWRPREAAARAAGGEDGVSAPNAFPNSEFAATGCGCGEAARLDAYRPATTS